MNPAPPPPRDPEGPPSGEVRGAREDPSDAKIAALRKYLWWANVATFAALASALLAAWPGGRLIMRVLAFTSPGSAQGRLTEAQANVGFPTLEGSLALFFFAGLPAGYLVAILYVVLHRWLPAGRLAGPLLGILLLIWLGALLDPLRADNIDFNIVGPGWLAVALFTGLSILHGAVAAAAAGWWSERLPAVGRQDSQILRPTAPGMRALPACRRRRGVWCPCAPDLDDDLSTGLSAHAQEGAHTRLGGSHVPLLPLRPQRFQLSSAQ